jgi:hypothetical protein
MNLKLEFDAVVKLDVAYALSPGDEFGRRVAEGPHVIVHGILHPAPNEIARGPNNYNGEPTHGHQVIFLVSLLR